MENWRRCSWTLQNDGPMHEILSALNVKSSIFLKGATDFRPASLLKNIASMLISCSVAAGVFLLSRSATVYLLQQEHIGMFLFHRFLSMLLYVFFITVNLGNMIVCYATLYRSEEVQFLVALPFSHAKIFVVKFIDNFFYSSSTLLLLGLALLLGYGSSFAMPWYFYLFTLFAVLVPFMLIAALAAVILLMILIRVAAFVGIRWLLSGVALLYMGVIYVYFYLTNPVSLVAEVMRHYPDVNAYFGYLDPPFVRYLPNHWVAEYLYWTMMGDHTRAAGNLLALFLALAGLLVVAGILARQYYYKSWLTASDGREGGGGISLFRRAGAFRLDRGGPLPPQRDVLLRRDILCFLREPSQWLHLLLMALLLVVFLASIRSLELKLTQPFLRTVSYLAVFLFNSFFVASVALRFVFPSMSLEGDAFWCVRSAPVSLPGLYWQKFVGAFLPILVVSEVLAAASTMAVKEYPSIFVLNLVCTAFVALTLTGANLGAGTYFASYREKNPIRIASSQGASLSFLGSMVYLGCVVAILFLPVNRYFELLIFRGSASQAWVILPLAAVGVLSGIVFFGASALGLLALRRDQ